MDVFVTSQLANREKIFRVVQLVEFYELNSKRTICGFFHKTIAPPGLAAKRVTVHKILKKQLTTKIINERQHLYLSFDIIFDGPPHQL